MIYGAGCQNEYEIEKRLVMKVKNTVLRLFGYIEEKDYGRITKKICKK